MSKKIRARKLLEEGLALHRAGRLDVAEQAYLAAAQLDPRNPDVLNLRGVLALSTGKTAESIELFRKATREQPDHPGFWANLGNALFESGDFAGSTAAYRRAVRLDPGNSELEMGLGRALAEAGHTDEARQAFDHVASRHPGNARVWFNLGRLLEKQADREQAIAHYERALQVDPRYVDAKINLGSVFQSLNRLPEAEQCYRAAVELDRHHEQALANLVAVLTHLGRLDEAEQLASSSIAILPHSAQLHALLSVTLVQQGRLREALPPARLAVELNPDNVRAQLALGGLLFEAGTPGKGLALLQAARVAHAADEKVAHAVGITLLAAGHFNRGWDGYVHRVRPRNMPPASFEGVLKPDMRDRRVVLVREQGLGDELFFLRFAPLVKRSGAMVSYVADKKLVTMLRRAQFIDAIDESIGPPEMEAAQDGLVQMLIGDLPIALNQNTAFEECALPAAPGYDGFTHNPCPRVFYPELPPPLALIPDSGRVAATLERLHRLGPPPYLALTWRGGIPPHEQTGKWATLFKSVPVNDLGSALAALPFTLLAIQRKPLGGEIDTLAHAAGREVHDLCDVNDDLEHMLALLSVVDEYVGVSNTNMHLRAGVGRRARVLVPRPTEWRWMAYGNRSPWFPGFAVYRQDTDGQWENALRNLAEDLKARA